MYLFTIPYSSPASQSGPFLVIFSSRIVTKILAKSEKGLAEDNLTDGMPLTCCHDLKTKTALQVPCRSPLKQRPYDS
jgi:hypothetical protein